MDLSLHYVFGTTSQQEENLPVAKKKTILRDRERRDCAARTRGENDGRKRVEQAEVEGFNFMTDKDATLALIFMRMDTHQLYCKNFYLYYMYTYISTIALTIIR